MRAKYQRDEYRTTMFKKKIREILGTPWLRFYYSKGGCHICIMVTDFTDYRTAGVEISDALKHAGIEHKIEHWGWPFGAPAIRGINIPIDQEALPERARARVGKFQEMTL